MNKSTDILLTKKVELAALLSELGEPAWRAGQIKEWAMRGCGFADMTNLPLSLREKLTHIASLELPQIERKLVSAADGTVKYLFRLGDGEAVESVVMRYRHGNTVCVSSQAGCRMGCRFCASNTGGLKRNLTASEMLGQVIIAEKDTGERAGGIVLMGIGEPLDNYDNALAFIKCAVSAPPDGLGIGARHISLSTCGLADRIYDLAKEDLQITLSVSLHATSDAERENIMPVNKKWNIDKLLEACRYYFDATGRRVSFEYALIAGLNDDGAHAEKLASLLRKYFGRAPMHVNLIPVNEVEGRGFTRSAKADNFAASLASLGINATIRRRLGPDINASCGQLRSQSLR